MSLPPLAPTPTFLHPATLAQMPKTTGNKPYVIAPPQAETAKQPIKDDWSAHRKLLQTAPYDEIKNTIKNRKKLGIPNDVVASAIHNPDPFVQVQVIKSYVPMNEESITHCVRSRSDAVRAQIAKSNYPLLSSQIMALSLDRVEAVRNALFDSQRGYTDSEMQFFKSSPHETIHHKAHHYNSLNPRKGQDNRKQMPIAHGKIFLNGKKHEILHLLKNRDVFNISPRTIAKLFEHKNPHMHALGIENGAALTPEQVESCVSNKDFGIRQALCRSKMPLSDKQIYQLVGSDNETGALAKEILRSGRPLSRNALEMFRKHPNNEIVLIALQRQHV